MGYEPAREQQGYTPLRIEVRPLEDGQVRAKVLEGPGGRHPEWTLELPQEMFTAELAPELEVAVRLSARTLDESASPTIDGGGEAVSPPTLGAAGKSDGPAAGVPLLGRPSFSDLGKTLHGILCGPEVREHLEAGEPVSLRLVLPIGGPGAWRLSAVPWELLYDPENGAFLACGYDTPVVRDFALPGRRPLLRVRPPLRVLVVQAMPSDQHRLELGSELGRLREAACRAGAEGLIEFEAPKHPTLAAVRQALYSKPYDVLHFLGHGGFDRESGQGLLYFEHADKTTHRVRADRLFDHLQRFGPEQLQLVVLSSCEGGRVPRHEGEDPFLATAPQLLRRGLPAVVAMQFPVTGVSAVEFGAAFYGGLARGWPLEAAVTAGRVAIDGGRFPDEWVTPVLFLHARDGRLVEPLPEGRIPGSDTLRGTDDPAPSSTPLRLGIFTSVEWAERLAPDTDERLDLTELFDDRHIREPGLWNEVFHRLGAFLREQVTHRRPLRLDFTANATLAFAAGWCLDAKSGLDVTVRQRTVGSGFFDFAGDQGEVPAGPVWLDEAAIPREPGARDVALAVSVTHDVRDDVGAFLERTGLPVSRILPATIAPAIGQRSVQSGAHALELAQQLSHRADAREPDEHTGALHLFASAPNALLFFLGQLARGFGTVQLYEHDFGSGQPGAYTPSLRLPVAGIED